MKFSILAASAVAVAANYPIHRLSLKSEKEATEFFAKHYGIIPTADMASTATRHRYPRNSVQHQSLRVSSVAKPRSAKQAPQAQEKYREVMKAKESALGRAMSEANMHQLETMHTEFYDDESCAEPMYAPITEDNKDGSWRFFTFFHGMGGAPCQIRLLKDTVFQGFKNHKIKLTTATGDRMSQVSKHFVWRYSDEGLDGRARLICDTTLDLIAQAKANATDGQKPEKVGIFLSSNGMLDFLHSRKYCFDKDIDDKMFIYWVAAMDDKVDTESGGVAAKMMLAHIDKFFACAQEKYTEYGLHECWAPVGGSSELLNPELALHFKGKR
jgi:hypothetical protein